jgi:hypothetical protein
VSMAGERLLRGVKNMVGGGWWEIMYRRNEIDMRR